MRVGTRVRLSLFQEVRSFHGTESAAVRYGARLARMARRLLVCFLNWGVRSVGTEKPVGIAVR